MTQHTKAELLAKLAQEREKFETEQTVKRIVLEELPDDLPILHLLPGGHKSAAVLILEVQTRDEVDALFARLPAEPLVLVRNAFTSIYPTALLVGKEVNDGTDIAPFWWQADYVPGYNTTNAQVRWYWLAAPFCLVQIQARITGDQAQWRTTVDRDGHGHAISHTKRTTLIYGPPGNDIRFAGGTPGQPGAWTVFWYCEEAARPSDVLHS